MHAYVVAAVVCLAVHEQQTGRTADRPVPERAIASANLEGQWTVVYMEKDGRKVDMPSTSNVTIRGNTLTYNDGQLHSWRLSFGPEHTLMAWPVEGGRASADVSAATGTPGSGTSGTDTAKGGTTTAKERISGYGGTTDTGAHRGVYIFAHDFFCISCNEPRGSRDGRTGAPPAEPTRPRSTGTGREPAGTERNPAGTHTGAAPTLGIAPGIQPQGASFVMILRRHSMAGRETGRPAR